MTLTRRKCVHVLKISVAYQKKIPWVVLYGFRVGERSIFFVHYSEDRRTANVIALAPGVECLTVDRE